MKKKFNILRSVDLSVKYLKIFRKYITGQRLPNWKEINKKKGKRKEQKNERVLIAVSTGG